VAGWGAFGWVVPEAGTDPRGIGCRL